MCLTQKAGSKSRLKKPAQKSKEAGSQPKEAGSKNQAGFY
jgi:hypothetical protein